MGNVGRVLIRGVWGTSSGRGGLGGKYIEGGKADTSLGKTWVGKLLVYPTFAVGVSGEKR